MKILALLLLVLGWPEGDGVNRIVIDTSALDPGGMQVMLVDEGAVKVTVTRRGEVRRVKVERNGPAFPADADEYVVQRVDGELRARILSSPTGGPVVEPRRILVDGVALDQALDRPLDRPLDEAPGGVTEQRPQAPRPGPARYFICPADETMVRITRAHSGGLACPLDGTEMRAAMGRSSAIFLLD